MSKKAQRYEIGIRAKGSKKAIPWVELSEEEAKTVADWVAEDLNCDISMRLYEALVQAGIADPPTYLVEVDLSLVAPDRPAARARAERLLGAAGLHYSITDVRSP